ncbi:MAG: glycosyltransferase family 1 protein [Massilibacteroides sp.]|nr:glycosyltransferase family 1 protein [Massilibacteroides sp.]
MDQNSVIQVLIVYRETLTNDNIFVKTLYNELKKFNIDICCSLENFWDEKTDYDVIHIQWPEELTQWNSPDFFLLEKIKERFISLKKKGTKIIYTRHNLLPHYSTSHFASLYVLIEEFSDAIVHLGYYSLNEFEKKYPQKKVINRVIPHHIYENIYNENTTKQEARNKLNIPLNKFVILSFGKFRYNKEVKIILKTFFRFRLKNKYLLAPRFWPFQKYPTNYALNKRILSRLGYYLVRPLFNRLNTRLGLKDQLVNEKDIPLYFIAADIVLIQRHHILNSGNLPMGFLFKKVVVGPDCGNISELLRETKNPIFKPYDINSILAALKKAYNLSPNNWGENNYSYAKTYWNIERISKQYYNLYQEISNSN